jgi:pimeloyl-ACP methyl ester carboxylesterase
MEGKMAEPTIVLVHGAWADASSWNAVVGELQRFAGYPGAPEGDIEAFLKPSVVHESFAQDLPESDRWLIAAGQRPIALNANIAPTGTAAWKSVRTWAVIGTEDRVIPAATLRRMAERAGATVSEVEASHVSMVSRPQATVDAIVAAAATVDG